MPPSNSAPAVRPQRAVAARGGSTNPTNANDTASGSSVLASGENAPVPQPSAFDALVLTVTKLGSALQLSWTGSSGPFTLSYSLDASFQDQVQTLLHEFLPSLATIEIHPTKTLEVYDVTDASVVSPAVQGMGYDPEPTPILVALSGNDLWWNDPVTVSGSYFDKIASENLMFFNHRPQKANLATPGIGKYATGAKFLIPDDARSGPVTVQTHGGVNESALFLSLVPPTIGPYTNIRNVSYGYAAGSPEKGNIWVAADGLIQEVNLFQRSPSSAPALTGLTKPYLSRETSDGRILYVDGVNGHPEIRQITVSSGLTAHYADTTAGTFTRNILPVGIAVSHDGNWAFIADANNGKIVRVRFNNATAIIDNFGGYTWNFADPCAMDAIDLNFVFASDNDEFIAYTAGQFSTQLAFITSPDVAHSFEIDWDVSSTSAIWPIWNTLPTAGAYNVNAIAPSTNVWHTGAFVEGRGDGKLELDPLLYNSFSPPDFPPSNVIINNAGQTSSYSSPNQSLDRVLQVPVQGHETLNLYLELLDPPDLAAYGACDLNSQNAQCNAGNPTPGWPTGGFPYKADDNKLKLASCGTNCGLMTAPTGTPAQTLTVITDSSGNATIYLKVPDDYAGENYQIAVHKCPSSGSCITNRISYLTFIDTSWKRMFVERDKMFRRGGLLFDDFDPNTCGVNCQLKLLAGADIAVNDQVVLFDETNTYEKGATPVNVTARVVNGDSTITVTLDANPGKPAIASLNDGGVPAKPTFANGSSGGIGVISACDPATNQINNGSCFYDPDLRNIEQSFDDPFVQFLAPRSGMTALPFIATLEIPFNDPARLIAALRFHQTWFSRKNPQACIVGNPATLCNDCCNFPQNYLNQMSVRSRENADSGTSVAESDISWNYIGSITNTCAGCTAGQLANAFQNNTNHEFGHQFDVNCVAQSYEDHNTAWCGNCTDTAAEKCLMNGFGFLGDRIDGIDRFDCYNILQDPAICQDTDECGEGIRITADPK